VAAFEVIVTKELCSVAVLTIVIIASNVPTVILASASTADGITDVTVANLLVVCWVSAPVNTGIVSSSAFPKRSVPPL